MLQPELTVESVTYPPHDGYPLHVTAKCYSDPVTRVTDGLTLILLHATSFHKETWEPTLEMIFSLARQRPELRIREAWGIDCPNHGMAGALNERILLQPEHFLNFSCEKFAIGVHQFLTAGPNRGACIDFSKRNLVGIGHSLGGNAIAMIQDINPFVNFQSMVLVDPMLSAAGPEHLKRLRLILIQGAYERRDVWPNRDSAARALMRRDRTKLWDQRVLDLFVKYGVVPHPGSFYAESPYGGVTLACTRDQEAAMYRDPEGATKPVGSLIRACQQGLPVHLILGGVNDFMPKRTHEALKAAVPFRSVITVKEAGHLVPQEHPDKLGSVIVDVLLGNSSREDAKL